MRDWDRLVIIPVGVGIAIYSGYGGWRMWGQQKRKPAIGSFLLSLAVIAVPLALFIFGH